MRMMWLTPHHPFFYLRSDARHDAHERQKHEELAQQSAPEPGDRAGQPRKWGVYEFGDAGAEVCVQGVGVLGEKMRVCECVSV